MDKGCCSVATEEGRPSGRREAGGEREIRGGGNVPRHHSFQKTHTRQREPVVGNQATGEMRARQVKIPTIRFLTEGRLRIKGGHAAREKTPHETGEKNVNGNEENSRPPKGNPTARSR